MKKIDEVPWLGLEGHQLKGKNFGLSFWVILSFNLILFTMDVNFWSPKVPSGDVCLGDQIWVQKWKCIWSIETGVKSYVSSLWI